MIEPQVELGLNEGISVNSRADFVFYPAKKTIGVLPIAIFTDGWQYHASRVGTDFKQRMAIAKSGQYHVWSLTWGDVDSIFTPRGNYYSDLLELGISDVFRKNIGSLYQRYQCEELRSLVTKNSMSWLIHFLANPDRKLWGQLALMRTLAYIDSEKMKNTNFIQITQQKLKDLISQEYCNRFTDQSQSSEQRWGKHQWVSGDDYCLAEIYVSVLPSLHNNNQLTGSLIVTWLNLESIVSTFNSETADETYFNQDTVINELQKVWNGVLRQFNLFQFLPHSYVVTSNNEAQNLPFISGATLDDSYQSSHPDVSSQWQELESLLCDETAMRLFQKIKQQSWPLPEIGYELTNEQGKVIAEAEMAWPNYNTALVLDE